MGIVNIAGLLMDGKEDGLEMALRSHVRPMSLVTIAPTPPSAAFEHPEAGISRLIAMIRENPNAEVTLVGRSYGAFMALMAAVRMDFEKILKVILIEGPLNPDVAVTPPGLIVPLLACGSHYDARPELAREAAEWLEKHGSEKVVVVQGGAPDAIVENAAQIIPGDFDEFDLAESEIADVFAHNGRGKIVRLSPSAAGHTSGVKKILPQGYRNHLFWSDEKMAEVMRIIAAASGGSEGRFAAE